eukprot:TRINITY_DN14335_c0_g1_i10.p2 TRINITY_DN14335_c0_g1~~TRINITY_DN14335_c0_g1_i10.p2  ORF type:complete len:187 (-),score=-26.15 TRINITY_DN14335_c0_g1_i10:1238-1798(-)
MGIYDSRIHYDQILLYLKHQQAKYCIDMLYIQYQNKQHVVDMFFCAHQTFFWVYTCILNSMQIFIQSFSIRLVQFSILGQNISLFCTYLLSFFQSFQPLFTQVVASLCLKSTFIQVQFFLISTLKQNQIKFIRYYLQQYQLQLTIFNENEGHWIVGSYQLLLRPHYQPQIIQCKYSIPSIIRIPPI